MLSGTAEYALRAVLYLAQQEAEKPIRVGDVASALGAPRNYLSKILHELTRAGVLSSSRGKRGGFQLAQPADEVSLLTVVHRFDHIAAGRQCLLGRSECSDKSACAAHWRWKSLSDQLSTFFRETTVADLLAGTPLPAARPSPR